MPGLFFIKNFMSAKRLFLVLFDILFNLFLSKKIDIPVIVVARLFILYFCSILLFICFKKSEIIIRFAAVFPCSFKSSGILEIP